MKVRRRKVLEHVEERRASCCRLVVELLGDISQEADCKLNGGILELSKTPGLLYVV
jgi:hypothetical protein